MDVNKIGKLFQSLNESCPLNSDQNASTINTNVSSSKSCGVFGGENSSGIVDPSFMDMLGELLSPSNLPTEALPHDVVVILVVFYCLIIALAVVGNVVVIIVISRYRPRKSVTDLYILSLAVSDLLIAILNMPFQLYFVCANEWLADGVAGEVLCKFTNYVQGVTIVACVLTLTSIAIDRYIVICQPKLARLVHSKRSAIVGILIVWFIALCVLSPHLVFQRLDPRLKITSTAVSVIWVCAEFYPRGKRDGQIYAISVYVCLYCIPVLIMISTYGAIAHRLWFKRPVFPVSENSSQHYRSVAHKKKITKLLIVLVLGFTVLWLPFFTFSIIQEFSVSEIHHLRLQMAVLQLVGYSNCCVNPIMYTFLNNSFQKEFLRKCHCLRSVHSPGQSLKTEENSRV